MNVWAESTDQLKRHLDPISRFATIHFADRPTDRQTDGQGVCSVIVLSHWPHVATHVATQVAQLVASVKGLGHKWPNLWLNLCGNMWPV